MLEIVDARTSPARIKVFGIGGGGSNAVNRMIQAGLAGVEFWIANTDLQALEKSDCPNRLQVGNTVTRGLGAGGDPEIGRLAAEEDRASIAEAIRGADMLFVTAGMGGGTGTGGAPVVAEVAREAGILTVAVVTKPFVFEGKKKNGRADSGLADLARNVDTLIVIPNQKLLNIVEPGTPFRQAMLVADEVLLQATRGISDLVTGHGEINLDFADVKSVMRNRGNALLGCGVAVGKDRAVEAAQAAVSSPLLDEVDIFGAEALIINVQGGPEMSLHEAAEAAQFISERVGEEADVYWGAVIDPALGEEMRVTVIATGFSGHSRGDRAVVPAQTSASPRLSASGTGRDAMVEAASSIAFAPPRLGSIARTDSPPSEGPGDLAPERVSHDASAAARITAVPGSGPAGPAPSGAATAIHATTNRATSGPTRDATPSNGDRPVVESGVAAPSQDPSPAESPRTQPAPIPEFVSETASGSAPEEPRRSTANLGSQPVTAPALEPSSTPEPVSDPGSAPETQPESSSRIFARYAESSFRAMPEKPVGGERPAPRTNPPAPSPEPPLPAKRELPVTPVTARPVETLPLREPEEERHWGIPRDAGSDIFLEVEDSDPVGFGRGAKVGTSWDRPERPGESGREMGRTSLRREEGGTSPRLRRRHPLDEPTFMRLKMD